MCLAHLFISSACIFERVSEKRKRNEERLKQELKRGMIRKSAESQYTAVQIFFLWQSSMYDSFQRKTRAGNMI